jgi:hypothetical protein
VSSVPFDFRSQSAKVIEAGMGGGVGDGAEKAGGLGARDSLSPGGGVADVVGGTTGGN